MRRPGLLEIGMLLFAALLLFFGVKWLLFPGQMFAVIPYGRHAPRGEYTLEVSGTFARVCGVAAILIGTGLFSAALYHLRGKH